MLPNTGKRTLNIGERFIDHLIQEPNYILEDSKALGVELKFPKRDWGGEGENNNLSGRQYNIAKKKERKKISLRHKQEATALKYLLLF